MLVKPLSTVDIDVLIDCFLEAFTNYYVPMPTDKNYYKQRWQAAKVDYKLSFGMFDNDKLVGFIIHAIAPRGARLVAYNSGTGVIPTYRGQGIVNRIYKHALPILKEQGITHSVLEVISENNRAIKAYKNVGFHVCKNFPCFKGSLSVTNQGAPLLKKVSYENLNWRALPNQHLYSWDNHFTTLKDSNYSYYTLSINDDLKAYVVMNTDTGYIAQIEVLKDEETLWDLLLASISKLANEVRIVNVDDRLTTKINALKRAGLHNYVNQFEMELEL